MTFADLSSIKLSYFGYIYLMVINKKFTMKGHMAAGGNSTRFTRSTRPTPEQLHTI